MYCTNCGYLREVEAAFCSGCGNRWEAGGVAVSSRVAGSPVSLIEPHTPEPHAQEQPTTSTETAADSGAEVTWGGVQVLVGVPLVLVFLIIAAAASALLASLYPSQVEAVATWISVHLTGMAIIGTVWFLGVRRSRNPFSSLGLRAPHLPPARTVILTGSVLATSLVATAVYSAIVTWLGYDLLSPPAVNSDITFTGPAVLLTFQALAFVTPISEEIFFRGFIFGGLARRFGPWGAIIVSALIFSAFHISIGVIIPIFITGLLLAWLYWRTGSLWASIAAHAGQNALAVGVEVFGG